MEEVNNQVNKCDGRCETCNINQRTYCSSQIAYYCQKEISEIKAILSTFIADSSKDIVLNEKAFKTGENSVKPPYAEIGE